MVHPYRSTLSVDNGAIRDIADLDRLVMYVLSLSSP